MLPSTASSLPAFQFRDIVFYRRPYPHFEADNFLDRKSADSLLAWLSQKAQWQPRKLNGYQGYSDIPLQLGDLPSGLDFLLAPASLSHLRIRMGRIFEMEPEGYVKVTAHRLLAGSSLKPHCDLAPLKFTHRLLVHLNRGWTRQHGGLLCVLDGEPSAKKNLRKHKQLLPAHRSAFAFEISDHSFHAVTPVVTGERYTLSYTFYPTTAGHPKSKSA